MFSFVVCQKKGAEDFDILITNGVIVDGSGNNAYEGDIGITGDTIAEIKAKWENQGIGINVIPLVGFGVARKEVMVVEARKALSEEIEEMKDENLSNVEMEELKKMYIAELAKALSDKSKRKQIKKSVLEGTPHDPSPLAISGWDSYGIVAAKKNTHLIGKILSDLAAEQNRDAFDIVADLVIDEPDIYTSCGVLSENEVRDVMKYDWLMFCSDGYALPIVKKTDSPATAHPRAFGSQTRVLRKYVREETVLTLENAIRKMTSLPANLLRMKDRGLLKKGYKADVAIFNPETIRDNATFDDARQYGTGTEYVIVNGKISIENGKYIGALNGKLLLSTENK